MAAFPCPHCGHALAREARDDATLERCPSCDGTLLIAYRYRLVAAHGEISGGVLYEARDDGFDERVAVLFVEDPSDKAAVERFIEGSHLFADLGGRGLVKVHEIGSRSEPRPYVVMDWLDGGTLDRVVERRGALEQAMLLELIGDLLTGLSKAHRSMPAVVHGHVHPGKIGFRSGAGGKLEAVLFGFEWATQVNAAASRLADSFVSETDADEQRRPSTDLRQLAVAFYYAATGEWLGDRQLGQQRAQARARVPGPLGVLIDRMLGAGIDGYRSAVDAGIDFEQLMRGVDRWQGSQVLGGQRLGAAEDEDEDDDDDDDDDDQVVFAPQRGAPPSRPARASEPARAAATPDWAAVAARRQAEALARAQAQPKAGNPARAVAIFIAVSAVFTTCVAGLIAGSSDEEPMPPPRFEPQVVEAIPAPAPAPAPIPPEPNFEAEPVPLAAAVPALSGTFKYQGTVTGPEVLAGLALGETCEIWIEPNEGTLNCRWYIDCGEPRRRVYGGGTVGYSTCTVDDEGRPLSAIDEDDDAPDGAFSAELGTREPMLILVDRWTLPPVRVLISVTGGGLDDGPIPEVPNAPRLARDTIEARISVDDYPTIEPGVVGEW